MSRRWWCRRPIYTLAALAAAALLATGAYRGVIADPQPPDPVAEAPDPFLKTPAAGCTWEVPVLVISYLPTHDGVNVAEDLTGYRMSLADLRKRIMAISVRT